MFWLFLPRVVRLGTRARIWLFFSDAANDHHLSLGIVAVFAGPEPTALLGFVHCSGHCRLNIALQPPRCGPCLRYCAQYLAEGGNAFAAGACGLLHVHVRFRDGFVRFPKGCYRVATSSFSRIAVVFEPSPNGAHPAHLSRGLQWRRIVGLGVLCPFCVRLFIDVFVGWGDD